MTPATQRARPTKKQAEILRAMAGGARIVRGKIGPDPSPLVCLPNGLDFRVLDSTFDVLFRAGWLALNGGTISVERYLITDAGRKAIGEQP